MKTRKLVLYELITIERAETFLANFSRKRIHLANVDIKNNVEDDSKPLDVILDQGLVVNQRLVRSKSTVLDVPDIDLLYPFYQLLVDVDTFLVKLYRAGNLGRINSDEISSMRHSVVSGLDRAIQTMASST